MGAVNGRPARILIDGGAEGNVISSTFCKNNNVELIHSIPIPIILPNGSASLSYHQAAFSIARDAYNDRLSAIVYPLKKYDLIIGKPWLMEVNPIIDWKTNDLHFQHEGAPVFWSCRGFDSTINTGSKMVSALNFVALASEDDTNVYLSQVRIAQTPVSSQPDLTDTIRKIIEVEFPDVFPPELPDGLPPDRGDSMRIETEPFADPPVRP
ncbi:hypothetical protein BGZ50_000557, partial [Haplosporangium sp. Z 11]